MKTERYLPMTIHTKMHVCTRMHASMRLVCTVFFIFFMEEP